MHQCGSAEVSAAAQPVLPPEAALGTRMMWLPTGDADTAEEPARTWRARKLKSFALLRREDRFLSAGRGFILCRLRPPNFA